MLMCLLCYKVYHQYLTSVVESATDRLLSLYKAQQRMLVVYLLEFRKLSLSTEVTGGMSNNMM